MKVLNSFSLNMLPAFPAEVFVREIPLSQARLIFAPGSDVSCESCVGHADTAAIFSEQLGGPVPAARVTVTLEKGETILVGQYKGPRLPEGATTLPAGATIQWLLVMLK